MRFPKPTLDIDEYLQSITSLLLDDDGHIFIDTNAISLLFRLHPGHHRLRPVARRRKHKNRPFTLIMSDNQFPEQRTRKENTYE